MEFILFGLVALNSDMDTCLVKHDEIIETVTSGICEEADVSVVPIGENFKEVGTDLVGTDWIGRENPGRENVTEMEGGRVNAMDVGRDVGRENVREVGRENVKEVSKENVAGGKGNVSEVGREDAGETGRGSGLLAAEAPERNTAIGIETDDVGKTSSFGGGDYRNDQ